jgi:hypothetical protein
VARDRAAVREESGGAAISPQERRRHYESEITLQFNGQPLAGVERLYRRTALLEPTTVCAAHCRWCLRGQYPVKTLSEAEIVNAARYFGAAEECAEVDEILITGGDPLMAPKLLRIAFQGSCRHAPNIRTIRIGTRVPFQDPDRINDDLLSVPDLPARHPHRDRRQRQSSDRVLAGVARRDRAPQGDRRHALQPASAAERA